MLTFGTPPTLRVLPSIRNDTTFFFFNLKKNSYDTQLVVSIIGKIEKNYSGHFEK
jgi:hypothetical protein